MKAFFSRLHIGSSTKEKDRDNPPQRSTSSPTSYTSTAFKPLPELVPTFSAKVQEDQSSSSGSTPTPTPPYSSPTPTPTQRSNGAGSPSSARNGAASPIPARSSSPRAEPDSAGRSSRKTNTSVTTATTSDVQKKVAFRSPPPTPSNLDRTLPEAPGNATASGVPLKTSVSRFQAAHGKEPRGSTSTGASSSKTDVTSSAVGEAGSSQSLRSGTPYSSMSNTTSGSRILAAQSWSEVTEEDLVSNLGSRERTRQEVLFEIISSEERYVQELVKMKDTFIDPLLHPYSAPTPQLSSTPNLEYDYYRAESPVESNDHLPPIAARFMSPSPTIPAPDNSASSHSHKDTTPNIDGESLDTDEEDEGVDQIGKGYGAGRQGQLAKQNHPRSPYRSTATKPGGKTVPFPSRSHHSLPPPPRTNQLNGSTHSLGRQSSVVERERNYSQGQSSVTADRKGSTPKPGMLRKFKKSQTTNDSILGAAVAPHQLPEDLRICLEVVDSGVFDGHRRLSEALKKRYDDQFPLVRSLADVFVSNSDIFHGYATYVLHLERALEQVDDALSNVSNKKPKKQDVGEWQKVCKLLQKLEENASEKGETGLAITLSKPFQRLLKYPLLFQNLLFHTDPSTFEYESTLQMVAEVETIVRSIEDEKIQKEERDKTRDVFARIEGLDKVKQLALPKPSRVLIEERQCTTGVSGLGSPMKPASPPPAMTNKGVRGKSSFKRLSDVLHTGSGIGGKKDLWFVVFNDVVLQCQRTGTTSLPLVSATYSRTNSLPELQGRSKYATTGRRNSHTKPRNLYKFIKIETWAIGDVVQPREGVVSMEDVARSRAQVHQPRIVPLPDDDDDREMDSDDSDRKSKMSFSYWGADKITVQKPVIKGRTGPAPRRGGSGSSYGRESSANAKFGTRLVSGDSSPTPRPASRRTAGTPTSRRPAATDDSHVNYAKSTITPARPEWNNNTRSPVPGATAAKPRPRNISQTSAAVSSTRLANAKGLASPAPSEDSGVGLYRQMLAQDPSLNNHA
ncbi:DH domain-containing protein [Mycena venus]|uniref:DH domain-containing protein n=1 Tax=Mycena venus TaxID=2733690 RepID=A0A8H6XBN5_9AGAR|nr:DH domain-containing protein [Mycena venus]